jgi:Divergent InlB B-repeat domain
MSGVLRWSVFVLLTVAGLVPLGAAIAPGVAHASAELVQSTRVSADQPDEQNGPQIHFVYAVPAGGTDRSLDVDGTLDRWAANFNDWLAAQTGGVRLRLDTFGGVLDTTFVELKETDAQLDAMGFPETPFIENEVSAAGLDDPAKKYLIVYEGTDNFGFCGNALVDASVVYLGSCNFSDWLSILIGHEIFHLLGAVNTCAPHYGMYEETDDNPDDLMSFYVPDQSVALLDPGHDDYWGPPGDDNLPAACPADANVANSDFLISSSFFDVRVRSTVGGAVSLLPAGTTSGTCTAAVPCSATFSASTSLTLTPVAEAGYRFLRWDSARCPQRGVCTLVVGAPVDVGATFAADPYLLVKIKGRGRVRLPALQHTCTKSSCRFQIPYGTPTPVVAVAARGARFTGWAGACHGKGTRCSVRATASATLTATFAAKDIG